MVYAFRNSELDTALFRLRRGDRHISLRPKVYRLLIFLIEQRDRVVSKQELCEAVWSGRCISDTTMETTLMEVRRALGDSDHRLIQTIPGHGYRFVADAEQKPASSEALTPTEQATPEATIHSAEPHALPAAISRPERAVQRQIAVLFCSLRSLCMAGAADLEELRDLLGRVERASLLVIERFHGYLAQTLSDGFVVYFSYPEPREDAVWSAVSAGLGIAEAVEHLRRQLPDSAAVEPSVRIGIDAGMALIAGQPGSAPLALGTVPSAAARLSGLAEPSTVVISARAHEQVQGRFVCRELESQPAAEPGPGYQVCRSLHTDHRLRGEARKGPTPFVGRRTELGLLMELWTRVQNGEGQQRVLIEGEPGIGKSRLVQMLRRRLRDDRVSTLNFRCTEFDKGTPLRPVIDFLEQRWHLSRSQAPEARLMKLEQVLRHAGHESGLAVALLAFLLEIPDPEGRYPVGELSPAKRKQEIFKLLLNWLETTARDRPLLLVCEDLHWADQSTLELLELLLDRRHSAPLLTVLTHRPGFSFTSPIHAAYTRLDLGRMAPADVAEMIIGVLGGLTASPDAVEWVTGRSDGVPLFIEECTRLAVASGGLRRNGDAYVLEDGAMNRKVPDSLQDLLSAQLAALAPADGIASLAALLGREFSYRLLLEVGGRDEETLRNQLESLVDARILQPTACPPHASFRFRHALFQNAAHQSLLPLVRRQHHQRIAEFLECRHPEIGASQPEILARHWGEAGENGRALDYFIRSAETALARSAYREASALVSEALKLSSSLPDDNERLWWELRLQTALGSALTPLEGFAAPSVERVYRRTRQLCHQVAETPQLFPVLYGLFRYYHMRGEIRVGRTIAEQMIELASRIPEAQLRPQAHMAMGASLLQAGEPAAARSCLEEGIARYNPHRRGEDLLLYGYDAKVASLAHLSWALAWLGLLDSALATVCEAMAWANTIEHPWSLAIARHFALRVWQWRGELNAVKAEADANIALAGKYGFPFFGIGATILRGWVDCANGEFERGLAQIRESMSNWLSLGAGIGQAYHFSLLADGYRRQAEVDDARKPLAAEGLKAVAAGLAIARKTGERCWDGELYRLKGELLILLSSDQNSTRARAAFRRAVEISRGQQSTLFELRATASWAHYRSGRGTGRAHESCWRHFVTSCMKASTRRHCRKR